jgi:hypothetical protein
MPLSQWNVEWLNHNSQRNYPLADEATALDKTGSFEIPEDFLVELDLPIHAAMDMEPGRFFIRTLGVFPTGFSLTLAYNGTDAITDVATVLIPRASHTRNTTYALGGVAPFDDTVGKVVIGKLDTIDKQPAGVWEFDLAATRLEPDVIRPIIRGVQALMVVNGSERSERLQGDIEIVPGENMQITPVVVEGEDPKLIFSAISGEGTIEECVCEGEEAELPPIKRINGVAPTPSGEMSLIGDDCIEVVQTENGLKLIDNCCAPCCGCEELEAITRDLERFNQQRVTLERFVDLLQVSVNEFALTVLGARLGDRGCITCE